MASFCYFATEYVDFHVLIALHVELMPSSVHSASLGKGKSDDTLIKIRNGDLTNKGEITMVFGKQDTHVDREGRSLIRNTMDEAGVILSVSFLQYLPSAFS